MFDDTFRDEKKNHNKKIPDLRETFGGQNVQTENVVVMLISVVIDYHVKQCSLFTHKNLVQIS